MLLEVLRETVIDSLKLLPFLFAAYLAIEFIEDRAEEKTVALVHRAGRWGLKMPDIFMHNGDVSH